MFLFRPPMWSSGQTSWLQIQRSWVWFPALSDFLRSSGCGQGPLVSTIEELLGRKSSGSGLEIRGYSCGDPLSCSRDTLYPLTLSLNSPTSGCRSVGIVRSQIKTTEYSLLSWSWVDASCCACVLTKIINQLPLFATYRVFIVHKLHYMFRLYGHPQVYHIYKNATIINIT
jgi:hypothetical protein